jgi:AraC-like DNA-binding protein
MILYVKNMYCTGCNEAVKSEFEKLGLKVLSVNSGEVRVRKINNDQYFELKRSLEKAGFKLLNEDERKVLDRIKGIAEELIYYSDEQVRDILPDYLARRIKRDYTYLSKLFFEVKNTSIEDFISKYRIERAKELLVYYRLNLNEIALQLNFNSVASLTNQFREVSGYPPSHFQESKRVRQTSEVDV